MKLGERKCIFCKKIIKADEDRKILKSKFGGFDNAHRNCWKKYGWNE